MIMATKRERNYYDLKECKELKMANYVQKCDQCQKQRRSPPSIKNEIHSVPVSPNVMKHIGLALCSLPEVDGYCYLNVCIDYFSKWSEAKSIRDKTVLTVAHFCTS